MKLYIGGAGQGQLQLAETENPDAEILTDFQDTVRQWLHEEKDPVSMTEQLIKSKPDAIIVTDEVGCGVVPMEKEDRIWREAVGRAQCCIAGHSEAVVRVVCGIGVRIK